MTLSLVEEPNSEQQAANEYAGYEAAQRLYAKRK